MSNQDGREECGWVLKSYVLFMKLVSREVHSNWICQNYIFLPLASQGECGRAIICARICRFTCWVWYWVMKIVFVCCCLRTYSLLLENTSKSSFFLNNLEIISTNRLSFFQSQTHCYIIMETHQIRVNTNLIVRVHSSRLQNVMYVISVLAYGLIACLNIYNIWRSDWKIHRFYFYKWK